VIRPNKRIRFEEYRYGLYIVCGDRWSEVEFILEQAELLKRRLKLGCNLLREEDFDKATAVLRFHGYEVTLPANLPLPQDDGPHTE